MMSFFGKIKWYGFIVLNIVETWKHEICDEKLWVQIGY